MLEIFALAGICVAIGKRLRAKSRRPLGYQILTIVIWFLFEIAGAVVGLIIHTRLYGYPDDVLFSLAYVFALIGAVIAGLGCYWFCRWLPARPIIASNP
jgi:hypothetical protein